jgi:hypothetical protein
MSDGAGGRRSETDLGGDAWFVIKAVLVAFAIIAALVFYGG